VHRLLGEELEHGRADVAAMGSAAATAAVMAGCAFRRHRSAATGVVEAVAGVPAAAFMDGMHGFLQRVG
jgi:hypothetical protein